MKKSIKKSPKKSLIVSSLAVAIQGLLLASASTVAYANTTTVKKPIGDLEIYQTAKGGKITLTMMLDTSGSMSEEEMQDGSACEILDLIDGGIPAFTYKKGKSDTNPSYDTWACELDGKTKKVYSALYVPALRGGYTCQPNGSCLTSQWRQGTLGYIDDRRTTADKGTLNVRMPNGATVPYETRKIYTIVNLTDAEKKKIKDRFGDKLVLEDRLTRLKNALFKLMDDRTIITENKVSIGIGQFSTQSDSNGNTLVTTGGGTARSDGLTGKIVVPAAPMSDAHRQTLRNAIAKLYGAGGTPAASAYAEAGAYMLGETTTNSASRSGYGFSVASSKDGEKYKSPMPAEPTTCDGSGIYFLTDGQPNSSDKPEEMMKKALGNKGGTFSYAANTLPAGTQNGHGMPQVGAFAKALRIASNNPKNTSIRTAVVGFGSVFSITDPEFKRVLKRPKLNAENMPVAEAYAGVASAFEEKEATYFNCDIIPTNRQDARNACNWGAKSHPSLPRTVGGYGEGGFYSAQSEDDVIQSVQEFLGIMENDISSTPSGTISIPDDPYSVASQQAVAYMPMIEPKVASKDMIWPGNMKKYHLRNGTIWGKNGQRLYTNVKGDLNANAQDGWSTSTAGNNQVTVGGFYAHLKNPKGNIENVRQLFIEDFSGAGTAEADKKPKARKFGVNAQGKITLEGNAISASNTFHDTATYTTANVKYLLHFLGFTHATVGGAETRIGDIPDTTALADITLKAPIDEIRVLGGSPHSTPTALSYEARLTERGSVSVEAQYRKDYVLFGSMDGALHLVDARDKAAADSATGAMEGGSEVFAFIPKVMLTTQAKALQKGATHNNDGQPVFGVDAPWAVITDYDFDNENNPTKMQVDTSGNKGVYAYGGFRLGGEGLYGLKLNDKNNPELRFALTPQKTGFERLGQIWSKPTKAKIKNGDGSRDVLIFGGGYDLCYENENFQVGATGETYTITQNQRGEDCAGKTEAVGNAVYMVDAHTGERLWTGTSGDMKHSIVASVNTLDRDNDGNLDAIYFADLGGQVFRADFDNINGSSTSAKRIVRLLQPHQGGTKYARRFYEKPVISIYRGDAQFNNGQLFALVNVISGDRSNPTSKMRVGKDNADRLYGIFDTDIGNRDLYTLENTALFAREIANGDLKDLSGLNGQEAKKSAIADVKGKKGWYQPLVDFDGYTNVNYGKGIGKSEVIGSLLFSSVYNPDKEYSAAQACVASIKGGTERQMYCLPYGVCLNERSTNGKGGFSPAGQGISELTLGPLDGTAAGSRKRTLISNVGLNPDGSTGASRTDFGEGVAGSSIEKNQASTGATKNGGMGSHPDIIADPRFTLQPVRWYDNTVKN